MNKIQELIEKEKQRQEDEICLIASENYTYPEVMEAQGSCLTNRYAEGYPNARYYAGCKYIDEIEQYAIDKAKELFKCNFANVQPHSGSQANQAVYLSLLNAGNIILGMDLSAGGHLTHGAKVSSSGKLYKAITYGLDENGVINYKEIEEKLIQYKPRLLIVGASAYSRNIDFKKIKNIIDSHNKLISELITIETEGHVDGDSTEILYVNNDKIQKCIYMVDMAHIAGLVATGEHESPLPYADIVTSTTHKTLRGPRGGLILWNDEKYTKKINSAVFPGIQGGPLEHAIAGKAICFEKALEPYFKQYAKQIKANIKAMEQVFNDYEIKMVTGGSDNHLILLDLKGESFTGKELEDALTTVGIITNKNAVVGDTRNRFETSGLRIGTACITARGMKETEAKEIANYICMIICELRYKYNKEEEYEDTFYIPTKVNELCNKFPLYKKQ